jgi:hypothetical protein
MGDREFTSSRLMADSKSPWQLVRLTPKENVRATRACVPQRFRKCIDDWTMSWYCGEVEEGRGRVLHTAKEGIKDNSRAGRGCFLTQINLSFTPMFGLITPWVTKTKG